MTLLLLLAVLPIDPPLPDRVDLIEVNHVYHDDGRRRLTQVVFYDWSPRQSRYRVRAWRLIQRPNQKPERDYERGGYTMIFHDLGELRVVRSAAAFESWTSYDVEREERDNLPAEMRLGLMLERKGLR